MQEAKFSILHWARRGVVSTLYAESLILSAKARAVVISWMQSKIPSNKNSPGFPRLTLYSPTHFTLHMKILCFSLTLFLSHPVFLLLFSSKNSDSVQQHSLWLWLDCNFFQRFRTRKNFGVAFTHFSEIKRRRKNAYFRESERERERVTCTFIGMGWWWPTINEYWLVCFRQV